MSFSVDGVVAAVRKEVQGRNSVSSSYDAVLVELLNDIHQTVWYAARWKFILDVDRIITMVNGQQEYPVDATIAEIRGAYMTVSHRPVALVNVLDLIKLGYNLTTTGDEPNYMWISGYDSSVDKLKVQIWPIPTTTRTITLPNSKVIVDLVSGGTVPLTNDFRTCYKMGLKSLAYLDDGKADQAGQADKFFRQQLIELIDRHQWPVHEERVRAIQDVPGLRSVGPKAPSNWGVTPY